MDDGLLQFQTSRVIHATKIDNVDDSKHTSIIFFASRYYILRFAGCIPRFG
jgi:hypothetical protein